ncbi:hypothetical protein HWV62_31335 [Athelia sp. TMB]|nr:hypothetical protein HWV62_31335 [Athelia sp. TMB]
MDNLADCFTCCGNCLLGLKGLCGAEPPLNDPVLEEVSNLLPAGVIKLPVGYAPSWCTHTHAADGWHPFSTNFMLSQILVLDLALEYTSILGELKHLIDNGYLRCTYQNDDIGNSLYVRIYMVPFDLPGVNRSRDEKPSDPGPLGLRSILKLALGDMALWNGPNKDAYNGAVIFPEAILPATDKNRTLGKIYGDIPSPLVNSKSDSPLIRRIFDDGILGMRSTLYSYQKRTVARMCEVELSRDEIDNPLYISVKGMGGDAFFLQPGTLELLRKPPMVRRNRGGILCEELGTGKTVMILALVMATLDQLPDSEQGPVMTPLALELFPGGSFETERNCAALQQPSPTVPSLKQIMIHYCRIHSEALRPHWRERLEQSRPELFMEVMDNIPFYHDHTVLSSQGTARRMYLTSASLIVVPNDLIQQWHHETTKHCESNLRVLTLVSNAVVPSTKSLASRYDLVLVALKSLAALADSLSQIRWKRLVVDEGHVASSTKSNFAFHAKELCAERRWIVTGTPTTNILELNLGINSQPEEDSHVADIAAQPDFSALRGGSIPMDSEEDKSESELAAVGFSSRDEDDLGKVRTITKDIEAEVKLPPALVETVLLDLDPYAVLSYNVAQAIIIINAVDSQREGKDYFFHSDNNDALIETLANLTQLMFWFTSKNCYGIHATLANKEEYLDRAQTRGACDSDLDLLRSAIYHCEKAYNNSLWIGMQQRSDVPVRIFGMPTRLIQTWNRIELQPEGPVEDAAEVFAHPDRLIKLRDTVRDYPHLALERLAGWGVGVNSADLAIQRSQQVIKMQSKAARGSKRRKQREEDRCDEDATLRADWTSNRKGIRDSVNAESDRAQAQLKHLAAESREEYSVAVVRHGTAVSVDGSDDPRTAFLASSPVANVEFATSTSTKLDYILEQVLRYSTKEKFLVFSESPLTLEYIHEGLKLVEVQALLATRCKNPREREDYVRTFQTSETHRVFLLEFKHAARGLNITAASRVIFCEPVWQPDVEAQAIKRAHRIGQTRPISVQTLVIRSTMEEKMLKRRDALRDGRTKWPDMVADEGVDGMKSYIKHPAFLPEPSSADLARDTYPKLSLLRVLTAETSIIPPADRGVQTMERSRAKKTRLL